MLSFIIRTLLIAGTVTLGWNYGLPYLHHKIKVAAMTEISKGLPSLSDFAREVRGDKKGFLDDVEQYNKN